MKKKDIDGRGQLRIDSVSLKSVRGRSPTELAPYAYMHGAIDENIQESNNNVGLYTCDCPLTSRLACGVGSQSCTWAIDQKQQTSA